MWTKIYATTTINAFIVLPLRASCLVWQQHPGKGYRLPDYLRDYCTKEHANFVFKICNGALNRPSEFCTQKMEILPVPAIASQLFYDVPIAKSGCSMLPVHVQFSFLQDFA